MDDTPRKRRYRPSGRALDDGRQLYHAYARVQPWVLEYLKIHAEDHGVSDAQTVGDFLTLAVEMAVQGLPHDDPERQRHDVRVELANQRQRTKPVRPARQQDAA